MSGPSGDVPAVDLLAPAMRVAVDERAAIAAVAARLAEVVASGGRVLTFGAGHSRAVAEEFCSRAGGLHAFTSMCLDDLRSTPRPAHEQLRDSLPERVPQNGTALLEFYRVTAGDAVIVVSQSGRNGAGVEMALQARRLGAYTAAVVSRTHAAAVTSRHPSGSMLTDVVDDVIDNRCPVGDAGVWLPGVHDAMGATSTIAGALIAQLVVVELARLLRDRDGSQVIRSANVDAAREGTPGGHR